MTWDNASVVARAASFIRHMSRIAEPSDIGVDLCEHESLGALASTCADAATGNPADTIVSLTLAPGPAADFNIKGSHAYGTLSTPKGWGSWLMITLTVAVLLIALVLCRR